MGVFIFYEQDLEKNFNTTSPVAFSEFQRQLKCISEDDFSGSHLNQKRGDFLLYCLRLEQHPSNIYTYRTRTASHMSSECLLTHARTHTPKAKHARKRTQMHNVHKCVYPYIQTHACHTRARAHTHTHTHTHTRTHTHTELYTYRSVGYTFNLFSLILMCTLQGRFLLF